MAKQIEVTKTFNAPVEMVWKVWTDPELVKRWWGPKHFISPVAKIDFQEGGKSIVSMKAPKEMGGQEFYSIWEYIKLFLCKQLSLFKAYLTKTAIKLTP
jgi:uncharacterized protein YndB with AHSA1/START domain